MDRLCPSPSLPVARIERGETSPGLPVDPAEAPDEEAVAVAVHEPLRRAEPTRADGRSGRRWQPGSFGGRHSRFPDGRGFTRPRVVPIASTEPSARGFHGSASSSRRTLPRSHGARLRPCQSFRRDTRRHRLGGSPERPRRSCWVLNGRRHDRSRSVAMSYAAAFARRSPATWSKTADVERRALERECEHVACDRDLRIHCRTSSLTIHTQ